MSAKAWIVGGVLSLLMWVGIGVLVHWVVA